MKSNREIRKETRALMLSGWFGKIFISFVVLNMIVAVVSGIVAAMLDDMEVQTWGDFLVAKARLAMQDLHYAVPSMSAAVKMSGATMFNQFIAYLFAAIIAFGLACVTLKAARNEAGGWFKSAFGGFSRPFGLLWLLVRMNIQVFLWSLLFIVPGIVAAYRYRLAWFLKSDNPDWGAGKCLAESGAKMHGLKWQAFCLDCSYLWWLFLFAATVAAMTSAVEAFEDGVVRIAVTAFALVVLVLMIYCIVRIMCGLLAARAVFYRALEEK